MTNERKKTGGPIVGVSFFEKYLSFYLKKNWGGRPPSYLWAQRLGLQPTQRSTPNVMYLTG